MGDTNDGGFGDWYARETADRNKRSQNQQQPSTGFDDGGFGDWYSHKKSIEVAAANTSIVEGNKIPQDRAFRISRVNLKTGWSPELIDAHLEEFEHRVFERDFDINKFVKESPTIARWIAESPTHSSMTRDEIKKMADVEKLIRRKRLSWPLPEKEINRRATAMAERWRTQQRDQAKSLFGSRPEMLEAQFGHIDQRLEEIRNDALETLRDEEEFIRESGRVGFFEAVSQRADENPLFLVPFLGAGPDIQKSTELMLAAFALEDGEETQEQKDLLVRYARMAEAAERRGTNVWGATAQIMTELPATAIEFGLTAGTFSAAKLAILKGGRKGIEKFLRGSVNKLLNRNLNRALRVTAATGGALAQTGIAGLPEIIRGTVEGVTPPGNLTVDKDGNMSFEVFPEKGKSFGVSLSKSIVTSFTEIASERAGGTTLFKLLEKGQNKVLFGWWRGKNKFARKSEAAVAFQKAVRAGGIHGVLGEMGEEEVAKLMQAVAGIQPYRLPTGKELAAQAMAFGAPAVVRGGLGFVGPEIQTTNTNITRDIANTVKDTKLMQEAPQHVERLVKESLRGTELGTTYIPIEAWQDYWESQRDESGVTGNPRAVAKQIMGDTKAYDVAAETGIDLAMPTEKYVRHIAATEHAEFFQEEHRLDPRDMTSKEADAFFSRANQTERADNVEGVGTVVQQAQDISDNIAKQLRKTKYDPIASDTFAKAYEAFFRTQGIREGLSPQQIFDQLRLQVSGEDRRKKIEEDADTDVTPELEAFASEVENLASDLGINVEQLNNDIESTLNELGVDNIKDFKDLTSEQIEEAEKQLSELFGENAARAIIKAAQEFSNLTDQPTATVEAEQEALEEPDSQFEQDVSVDKPRGRIRFGDSNEVEITVFENADMSTFLHESGHYFLEVLSNLSRREEASDQLKADFNAIKTWFSEMDGAEALAQVENFAVKMEKRARENPENKVLQAQAKNARKAFNSAKRRGGADFMKKVAENFGTNIKDKKMRGVIMTPYHEMFAQGMEKYFATASSAPSRELRSVFARFRTWLARIYNKLKGLDVELSPEVTGVMDRMFATDEEITATMGEQGMVPLLPEVEKIVSGKTAKKLRDALENVVTTAQERLNQNIMEREERKKKKEWKENRQRVSEEFMKDFNAERVTISLSVLQTGKMPDGSDLPSGLEPIKLSRRKMVEIFGSERVKNLPNNIMSVEGIFRVINAETGKTRRKFETFDEAREFKKGKKGLKIEEEKLAFNVVDPEAASGMLGYETSGQMVSDMEMRLFDYNFSGSKESYVNEKIDERMEEEFGDPAEFTQIPDDVMDALHNDSRSELLRLEMEVLVSEEFSTFKKLVQRVAKPIPTIQSVRERAQRDIDNTIVRDVRPIVFLRAEQKWAKRAMERMLKGDFQGVVEAKSNELLNHEKYIAAIQFKEKLAKDLKFFQKLSRSDAKLSKSRDVDFVNGGRAILAEYGLQRSDRKAQDFLKSLREFGDPDQSQTIMDMVDIVTKDAADYREVSADKFKFMSETVRSLFDLSIRNRKIEIEGQLIDREEVKEALFKRIDEIRGKPLEVKKFNRNKSKWEDTKFELMGWKAALTRVEPWADAMDGNDPSKPFTRLIWRPISQATNKYREDRNIHVKAYLDLLKTREEALKDTSEIDAPELGAGEKFQSKSELLGAILHTGNESNLSKLIRGYGWGTLKADGTLDTSKWDRFTRRMWSEGILTREDYEFAQSVWDLMEKMKPAAQRAHKKMYGHFFNEVTAQEIVTPFGTFKGGYVPANVAPNADPVTDIRREKEDFERSNNSFMFPTSGRGFTRSRMEGYSKPLELGLQFLPRHIDNVMRFVHIEPHVKDLGRLFNDADFVGVMHDFDQGVVTKMLMPWLQRAASQRVDTPTKHKGFDQFWRALRSRTSQIFMFADVVNSLQQFTGLSLAAIKVPPKYLRNGLYSYIRDHKGIADLIAEKSLFMKNRTSTQLIETRNEIEDLILNPTKFERAKDFADKHAFFMQIGTQNIVDIIVWQGAYEQSIEQKLGEKEAVERADAAVRTTQGDFSAENLSSFETGSPVLRAFTMFYSYFNMQANALGAEFLKVHRDMGLRQGAGRLFYVAMFGFVQVAFVAELIALGLRGDLDSDDDDVYIDDVLANFFYGPFRNATAMVPIFGRIAQSSVNQLNDKWYDDRISTTPIVSVLEKAAAVPADVYNAISGDLRASKGIRDILTLVSLATGIPVANLGRPAQFLADVSDDKVEADDPIDFVTGVLTGRGERK